MKLSKIIAAAAIMITMSSCSVLGSISGSNSSSLENGIKVGSALLNLYNQYKDSGTINMTNLANVNSVASIVNGIQNIKSLTSTDSTLADYAQGLINGSSNLVNSSNASSVINGLTSLANTELNGTTSAASLLANQAVSSLAKNTFMSKVFNNVSTDGDNLTDAVSSITSLFGLLK